MDEVFETWLERQHADGAALGAASDVVEIVPEPGAHPARRYIAKFDAPTMVRAGTEVTRARGFVVLLNFPPDYVRFASDAGRIVNLLAPGNLFHPNVTGPFICVGRIAPGTGLVELVYRLYEILTFQRMTLRENDALNHDACAWVRGHMRSFPLGAMPLRRRARAFSVREIPQPEGGA